MAKPLVSIVIPCYNAEKYLLDCLNSLMDQVYKDCEIIVIDDGSTDSSLEIIQSFGNHIIYETGPNKGACAARNRGLELAKGKYVKFFDADDLMMPNAISAQVEAAEKLGEHEITYGQLIDLDNQKAIFNEIQTTVKTPRDEMVYACFSHDIITGCPLHRRQFLIDHHLGFDEKLITGQEWDFHLTIALAGGIFVFQPEVIYQYRNHQGPDRISQRLKKTSARIESICVKQLGGCKKIIAGYGTQSIPAEIKNKMSKRLAKIEARCAAIKLCNHVTSVREIRYQLAPWWKVLLLDIRYISYRYRLSNT